MYGTKKQCKIKKIDFLLIQRIDYNGNLEIISIKGAIYF